MLRLHLAHSWTQMHRSQPQRSLGCFLCFHRAIIERAQTTTSGGKAADSSISNALRSPGREIYMGWMDAQNLSLDATEQVSSH